MNQSCSSGSRAPCSVQYKGPVLCIQVYQNEMGINLDQRRFENLGSITKVFLDECVLTHIILAKLNLNHKNRFLTHFAFNPRKLCA